jgi:hypothetical protein
MLGLSLTAALVAVGCSKDETTGNPVDNGTQGKRVMLQDTIKTSRTLSADTVYELKGKVKVAPGAVLTVQPGTRIEGEAGSFLIMQRGTATLPSGRLEATGTPEKPIVFTSIAPEGSKATGQWGGLVFCGLASNNQPNGSAFIEGDENPDQYGWGGVLSGPKDDDNSGTLKYVIVEFGGFEIKPGSEINGITFYAVGSGTTIDYVQSHYNNDDGFEFFGGTVNIRHCISSGNSDDCFDLDNGWQGHGQFLLAVQRTGFGKFARGHEVDNNADGTNAQPFTSPQLANVTFIGAGSTADKQGTDGDPNDGCYWRRGAQGQLYNYLVYNFGGAGFVMDVEKGNPKTDVNASNGSLFIKNSLLSNKRGNLASGLGEILLVTKSNGVYSNPSAELAGTIATWNNKTAAPGSAANSIDPLFVNFTVADNGAVPDLTLKAGSPALAFDNPVTDYPTNPFFDQTGKSYIGAFAAASTAGADWTKGWAHWNRQ